MSNQKNTNVIDSSAMPVGDLRKKMIAKIPENAGGYDRASMEYSIKMVKDFFTDIIEPNSKGGNIVCSFAIDAWNVYQEGKETERAWALRDELPTISQETMEYWRDVFELPVEKMLMLGRTSLLFGFDALNLWYRKWLLEIKYKCFFSDPNPETWIRKRDDIRDLENNSDLFKCPVNIRKCIEKMHAVHQHIISIQ